MGITYFQPFLIISYERPICNLNFQKQTNKSFHHNTNRKYQPEYITSRQIRPILPKQSKAKSHSIYETLNPKTAALEDIGVNHSGFNITVTKKLLNSTNIIAGFQQVCRKGVAERMTADRLRNTRT